MSTFGKKVTSAVAGLAIVFSVVSPIAGVSAALSGVESANQLATLGVIVDQSANPADYRLGDNLPRKEAVKVMMNLSSVTVVDNCGGQFNDLTSADWACKYAETALANGMVAANASFRPDDLVSKIEALKMVFQGRDLERDDNADWRAGYVSAAVSMGIATSFSDYNTPATRAEMFIWSAEAINMDDVANEDDPLCDLLGICEDDNGGDDNGGDDNGGDDNGGDTPVMTGGDLSVSLSPSSPASATIPGGVNGLAAAAFDFTAGDADVTVSQISIKRTGLSDQGTLDKVAVFTADGRVSNAKSDNQDNDTTAQINLDNGGVTIMAGQTKTMVIVVDVNPVAGTESDEFALELADVVANGDVSGLGARGNTMRVGSVDAPTITFQNGGSVSNPNLGETGADIFEFEIKGDSNEDVEVEAITFEGSSDAEDDLMNFELLMGNDVVATTEMMSGDYLTFNLGGLIIEEDKNEDFTVRADVVDGAGDTISFGIDAKLDVTANSTKFGFGAGVVIPTVDFPSITIQAGELTFVEVESNIDEIREDKDNVTLATFEVVNLSGNQLELEDFAVNVVMTDAGATTVGAVGPVTAVPSNVLEEVELYNMETGSSYELPATTNTNTEKFKDTGIDAIIGEGTSTWMVRADTAEDINGFDNLSFDISVDLDSAGTDVKINETMDDERVTDITPSNLSFDSIDGSESGAKVNLIPLSDTNVVRGGSDIVALEFEVEAEEISSVVVDEMAVIVRSETKATGTSATAGDLFAVADTSGVAANGSTITIVTGGADASGVVISGETATTITATIETDGAGAADPTFDAVVTALNAGGIFAATVNSPANGGDTVLAGDAQTITLAGGATGNLATKQEIAQVNLYLDSETGTMLDGDTISNAGGVTFDDMGDVSIGANERQTFVVTVDVVDGVDPVNKTFVAELSAISVEDDENDDITIAPLPVVSGRTVAVQNSGTIATLALDNANEDNEFDKLALAGNSAVIASWDVRGNNEEIDVETVTVTLSGVAVAGSLKKSVTTANLLLDGVVVGTASNSDISDAATVGTIVFDDLTQLILPETTAELAVQLNTASIGKDKVGETQTNLAVTAITLSDAEGDDSGKDAPSVTTTTTSKTMDIVPAIVTPSVVSTFGQNDTSATVRLVVDGGNNTTANGDAVQAEFVGFNYQSNPTTPTVENGNGVAVGASDAIGNDNEVYTLRIATGAPSNGTYTLDLDAVEYTINGIDSAGNPGTAAPYSTKLESTLELGEYTFSN